MITDTRDVKQKVLWCLFWANRKAIRTEGCAPFLIEQIRIGETAYTPEPDKILVLSTSILEAIERGLEGGDPVEFRIKIGNETFELAFEKNIFSIATRRNKEIEAEVIECLTEELKKGKPKICPSFFDRVGAEVQL